jgi:hypothetical protein
LQSLLECKFCVNDKKDKNTFIFFWTALMYSKLKSMYVKSAHAEDQLHFIQWWCSLDKPYHQPMITETCIFNEDLYDSHETQHFIFAICSQHPYVEIPIFFSPCLPFFSWVYKVLEKINGFPKIYHKRIDSVFNF